MTAFNISTAAFCLHSRPYRESSIIVQLFSEQTGRISAVVKGIKGGSRKNRITLPLFQPFIPIQVSLTGKSELKTVTAAELSSDPSLLKGVSLRGQALFAGLYVNELLMRLLAEHIEYPDIYHHYQNLLQALAHTDFLEPPLRQFERRLLENLGYGVPFVEVDESGNYVGLLQGDKYYRFVSESGFLSESSLTSQSRVIRQQGQSPSEKKRIIFHGACLLKIANDDVHEPEVALQAKQLMRMAIAYQLGDKPLNSKMLFT